MLPTLSADEARVIGSLIEKSVVTPDQYPLTLNALVNACNQKSSRHPVTAYSKGEVQRFARQLSDRSLVRIHENFRSGVEKYQQTFCNTRYTDLRFEAHELALVCVLLLRGPQTPGELRTNCRRLHDFSDNEAVVSALNGLAGHAAGPIVARLPRTPGRRDSEYMHRFSGDALPVDEAPAVETAAPAAAPVRRPASDLEARVARLEDEVAALRRLLDAPGTGDT